jgi:hypothetical protein
MRFLAKGHQFILKKINAAKKYGYDFENRNAQAGD